MSAQRSQEDRILWLLQAAWPNWTPALELARISLQYNARVFSLREKNWQIENKVEVRDGMKHGYFRLATPRTFPNPQRESLEAEKKTQHIEPTLPAKGSGLLFRDLPERIHPYPD